MSRDWRSVFADVREGLGAHPGRTGLCVLSMSFGVVLTTLMLCLLNGIDQRSEALIRNLGADVVAITPEQPTLPGFAPTLEESHAALLHAALAGAAVSALRREQVPVPGKDAMVTLIATDQYLRAVRRWPLLAGRFLDARDLRRGERHAVVSAGAARRWNWTLHQPLLLDQTLYTIVGIVDSDGGALGEAATDPAVSLGEPAVFVPLSTRAALGGPHAPPRPGVDVIFLRPPPAMELAPTQRRAERVLAQVVAPTAHLSWVSARSLAAGSEKLRRMIVVAGGGMALLCLLLGSTTLVSVMLANVRERVGEIGLRRALGATVRDIVELFVAETIALSLTAGIVGALAAHLLARPVTALWSLPTAAGLDSLLAPVLVGTLFGALAALWPARAAARIEPALALREN